MKKLTRFLLISAGIIFIIAVSSAAYSFRVYKKISFIPRFNEAEASPELTKSFLEKILNITSQLDYVDFKLVNELKELKEKAKKENENSIAESNKTRVASLSDKDQKKTFSEFFVTKKAKKKKKLGRFKTQINQAEMLSFVLQEMNEIFKIEAFDLRPFTQMDVRIEDDSITFSCIAELKKILEYLPDMATGVKKATDFSVLKDRSPQFYEIAENVPKLKFFIDRANKLADKVLSDPSGKTEQFKSLMASDRFLEEPPPMMRSTFTKRSGIDFNLYRMLRKLERLYVQIRFDVHYYKGEYLEFTPGELMIGAQNIPVTPILGQNTFRIYVDKKIAGSAQKDPFTIDKVTFTHGAIILEGA